MYTFVWIFALVCAFVLPLALAVELCVRKKDSWKPLLFGALTFTVFQGFLRIPALAALGGTAWFQALQGAEPALYALFLGATAALFEEGGRWLVMRFLLKKHRGVRDGICFGVGHGGIEAVLIFGLTAAATLFSGASADAGSPPLVLAGGAERVFALAAQIGFSVMVMKSVREKKPLWLLLAFVLHTLVDFGAAYAAGFLGDGASVWSIEICVGLFAAAMLWFVWKEWKREKAQSAD